MSQFKSAKCLIADMGRTRSRTSICEYTPWHDPGKVATGSSERNTQNKNFEWG